MLTNRNILRALLEVLAELEEQEIKGTVDYDGFHQIHHNQVPLVTRETEQKLNKVAFSVKELSHYLGISTDSIYSMVREKQVPHVRVRRRILFYKESIDNWLKR